jgi:hypothetical protein
MKSKKVEAGEGSDLPKVEASPQLSLIDEIAFEIILKAGPFSARNKQAAHEPITYPRILEDL